MITEEEYAADTNYNHLVSTGLSIGVMLLCFICCTLMIFIHSKRKQHKETERQLSDIALPQSYNSADPFYGTLHRKGTVQSFSDAPSSNVSIISHVDEEMDEYPDLPREVTQTDTCPISTNLGIIGEAEYDSDSMSGSEVTEITAPTVRHIRFGSNFFHGSGFNGSALGKLSISEHKEHNHGHHRSNTSMMSRDWMIASELRKITEDMDQHINGWNTKKYHD